MTINEVIDLLKAYNGPLGLTLHSGASEKLISEAEKAYGITLPEDFKALYRFTDGFETLEDIFNMIPLSEIIDNSKKEHELWIAEYMIYSDMWELEIDVEDPNDYVILSGDSEGERNVILTKSLAEFIARFLKGGVFEIGGLYAWKDEIKAKLYGGTEPQKIKPLFGVFHEGLILGLISKKEIVDRADWIIATEDEPHHFFIEISLSHDENELLGVLNSIGLTYDTLQARVILSVLHTQLLIDKITSDQAWAILEQLVYRPGWTPYERTQIHSLIGDYDYSDEKTRERNQKEFNRHLNDFLGNYSRFSLYNHKEWELINTVVLKIFEVKQLEIDYPKSIYRKIIKRGQRPTSKKLTLIIWILMAIICLTVAYHFSPSSLATIVIVIGIAFVGNFKRVKNR